MANLTLEEHRQRTAELRQEFSANPQDRRLGPTESFQQVANSIATSKAGFVAWNVVEELGGASRTFVLQDRVSERTGNPYYSASTALKGQPGDQAQWENHGSLFLCSKEHYKATGVYAAGPLFKDSPLREFGYTHLQLRKWEVSLRPAKANEKSTREDGMILVQADKSVLGTGELIAF